jgi:ubiquinol-cytochrome c reductase cytochrome c subunit
MHGFPRLARRSGLAKTLVVGAALVIVGSAYGVLLPNGAAHPQTHLPPPG